MKTVASPRMKLRHLEVRIAHKKLSGLQGATVVVDDTNKLLFHWIREGPYLTAGRRTQGGIR